MIYFIGAIASIIAVIYIFRGKLWKLLKLLLKLLEELGDLVIIYWRSFAFVFFLYLLWILDRKVNLLTIHWVALLLVFFAVLVWILDRKVNHLKRNITTSVVNRLSNKTLDLVELMAGFKDDLTILDSKVSRLESYVSMVFEDDFNTDLQKNWHYQEKWDLIPGGGLSVTQSEKGGITRVGQLWTDYSFEFTAVIVTTIEEYQCIGWIVRAQDLFNYYMIQLNPAEVRPHLRVGGRWITAPQRKYGYAIDSKEHDLSIKPKEPIEIRTEVRESELRVYVKNKEIYHEQKFFSMRFINKEFEDVAMQPGVLVVPPFTTGRVGFRMHRQEHGRFFECRVRPLHPGR